MLLKLTFSFSLFLNKCIDEKIKSWYFTNKVSAKEKSSEEAKSQFFARVFLVLKTYSDLTKKELEQKGICHIVKDEEVLGKIAEVLQAGGWNEEKIKKDFLKNLHTDHVYKFEIVAGAIRMFGIYRSDAVHILFFDPNHLVDPTKKKNFALPTNLTCTWCVKSCDKKS